MSDLHMEIERRAHVAADELINELWDRADYLGDLGLATDREGERKIARDRLRSHFDLTFDRLCDELDQIDAEREALSAAHAHAYSHGRASRRYEIEHWRRSYDVEARRRRELEADNADLRRAIEILRTRTP